VASWAGIIRLSFPRDEPGWLAVATAFLGPTPAAQQPPPPSIRSRTTLVPVDVRVVDRDGRPITDLKKEDFSVLENGRRQDVRFFATHALTPQPAPSQGAQPGGLLPLRPALGATAEPVMPDARVFELRSMGMGLDEYAATTLKGGQEISALDSAIRYLRQCDGGKHVIFVNEAGIFLPRLEDDHSLAAFANDARVAIHTIRTGGVVTMNALARRCPTCPTSVDIYSLGRVAPSQIASNQTVRNIAAFSGGISGSASIDKLLAQIDAASRFE
jgi:hypothetical protein